jgi:hypothetical protein
MGEMGVLVTVLVNVGYLAKYEGMKYSISKI